MARDVQLTLARVSRRAGQMTLFERTFREDILAAIDPRRRVTRYSRTWRFSRPTVLQDQFLAGKLGFERQAEEEETEYNEDLEDFTTSLRVSDQGRFSHYVLSLDTRYLVFEVRLPDIRRQSFLGAFALLLAQADTPFSVELVTKVRTFEDWLSALDRLQSFRATIYPPNPDWEDDVEEIRKIIEETQAELGKIELRAPTDTTRPGLKSDNTVITEVARHSELAHATYVAEGIADGVHRVFRSEQQVETTKLHEEDGDTSDAIWDAMAAALRDMSRPE